MSFEFDTKAEAAVYLVSSASKTPHRGSVHTLLWTQAVGGIWVLINYLPKHPVSAPTISLNTLCQLQLTP